MIPRGVPYEEAMRKFRWPKLKRFNIGRAVCERHPQEALALIVENADGSVRNWTFGQLLAASSRLANALIAQGIHKGEHCLLGIGAQTAVAGQAIGTESRKSRLRANGLRLGLAGGVKAGVW